jgi:hypothetical protein
VVVLIVSEETGAISLAFDGKMYYDLSPIEITRKLRELLDRGDWKRENEEKLPEISGGGSFGMNANKTDASDMKDTMPEMVPVLEEIASAAGGDNSPGGEG